MSANLEIGHFTNVSNFEDLISYCSSYGINYKPTKASIQLSALQQLYTKAISNINSLAEKQTTYKKAITDRTQTFEPLKKFSTRILNAFIACGANHENVKHVRYYVNKIRGIRKPKTTDILETTTTTSSNTKTTSHSTFQQSFDNMVEHLTNLISLLNAEPLYQPNEYELTITGLQELLNTMKAKNTAAIDSLTALKNTRNERNTILYDNEDGLVDKALKVKVYIKSVFGATSSEYKQINAVHFKTFGK